MNERIRVGVAGCGIGMHHMQAYRTLPERFEKMEDPLLPILGPGVDMGRALAAIRAKLEGKGEK